MGIAVIEVIEVIATIATMPNIDSNYLSSKLQKESKK